MVFVIFALVMATSFVVTTVLGVLMALRYGRSRRLALLCVAIGVVFALAIVLIRALA